MRISDWSSDVCSSDLLLLGEKRQAMRGDDDQPVRTIEDVLLVPELADLLQHDALGRGAALRLEHVIGFEFRPLDLEQHLAEFKNGRASSRDRVCKYV